MIIDCFTKNTATLSYSLNGTYYYFYIKKIHRILGFKTSDNVYKKRNKLGFCMFTLKPVKINLGGL